MSGQVLSFLVLSTASILAAAGQPAAKPIPKASDSPASVKTAAPASPAFRFPLATPKASEPPAPPPIPGAVPVLTADSVYVVPSDDSFLLFPSPEGRVKVTRVTGPLTVFGKFLDTPGTPAKLRTFAEKNLAIVEPVPDAKGRVELIAVPAGITDEAKAVRQMIDVNHASQPPPKPDGDKGDKDKGDVIPPPKPVPPKVDPEPAPKPTPVGGPLYFVLVEELDDRTVELAKLVNDTAFWQRMEAMNPPVHFMPFDKDEAVAKERGYVDVATKDKATKKGLRRAPGLPALLMLDKDGEVLRAVKASDTAAVEAMVKDFRP